MYFFKESYNGNTATIKAAVIFIIEYVFYKPLLNPLRPFNHSITISLPEIVSHVNWMQFFLVCNQWQNFVCFLLLFSPVNAAVLYILLVLKMIF